MKNKSGFTLVELSIVLVIIGLLIGGILIGQSLVESAKLNKVLSTANQYRIMTQLFYDKTRCIPGDCNKELIPGAHDGNGDKAVGDDSATYYREPIYATYQMQVMGIYKYKGDMSHCISHNTDDLNCYIQGPHKNSIFMVRSPSASSGGISMPGGPFSMPTWKVNDAWLQYAEKFDLDASTFLESSPNPILTPSEAKSIDIKGDDGMPSSGFIVGSAKSSITRCLDATNATAGVDYDLSKSGPDCNVLFYIGNAHNIHQESY